MAAQAQTPNHTTKMDSSDTQIKRGYEELGMTPAEIADDLKFDLTATKAKLMQISAQYRKDCGHESAEEDELNFSNEELKEVNGIIMDLARGAEDEHLRLKAATYIRDDKKGRKEVVKAVQHNNFNMIAFNETLQLARQKASQVKGAILGTGSNKIIEA